MVLGEPTREAIDNFREFKLQGTQGGQTLKRHLIASKIYLAISAKCERGFSALNDTDRKSCNKLLAKSLSSLLFVDINGPPLEIFEPTPFVLSKVKAGHHLSTSRRYSLWAEPGCGTSSELGGDVMVARAVCQ